MFQLQALTRIYRDVGPDKIKNIHDKVKKLEDAIGKWDAWNDFVKEARAVAANSSAIENLLKNQKSDFDSLNNVLKEDWLANKSVPFKILESMSDTKDLSKNEKYASNLVAGMILQIKKYAQEKPDFNLLEEGLHEASSLFLKSSNLIVCSIDLKSIKSLTFLNANLTAQVPANPGKLIEQYGS